MIQNPPKSLFQFFFFFLIRILYRTSFRLYCKYCKYPKFTLRAQPNTKHFYKLVKIKNISHVVQSSEPHCPLAACPCNYPTYLPELNQSKYFYMKFPICFNHVIQAPIVQLIPAGELFYEKDTFYRHFLTF